jgi:ABC-type Fe3+/spermidine/putrescine transport system ATPase subunit
MFDEPLGALDRNLRENLIQELRSILHTTGVPAIYVTHDQEEAFRLADRILMLHEGRIVREGTPAEIWNEPGSAWAARFLDVGNVIEGVIKFEDGKTKVETKIGLFEVDCGHHLHGEKVDLLVRPQGAERTTTGNVCSLATDVIFQQDRFKVSLANGLYFYLSDAPKVGEEVCMMIPTSGIQCLS